MDQVEKKDLPLYSPSSPQVSDSGAQSGDDNAGKKKLSKLGEQLKSALDGSSNSSDEPCPKEPLLGPDTVEPEDIKTKKQIVPNVAPFPVAEPPEDDNEPLSKFASSSRVPAILPKPRAPIQVCEEAVILGQHTIDQMMRHGLQWAVDQNLPLEIPTKNGPKSVRFNKFFDFSTGEYIINAIVHCSDPRHKEAKLKCHKNRRCMEREQLTFGPTEILGYLGAWLNNDANHATRNAHMSRQNNPKLNEIRDYLTENKLL